MLTLSSPLVVESHKGHSSSFPYSVSLKNQHQLLQSSEGGCIPSIESQLSMFTRMDTQMIQTKSNKNSTVNQESHEKVIKTA